MVRRSILLMVTVLMCWFCLSAYTIQNIQFISEDGELNDKQMTTMVYAEMVLKAKPQLTIENFKNEDYNLTSNKSAITITPVLEKAYFITYDNGNSDLHIPAVALNTDNSIASKMVVYNRSGEVFYEIEVMIPNEGISNKYLDYAFISEDYNGMLVTYNSKGL